MRTVKATLAIIDKSSKGFPLYVAELPVGSDVLWNYYHKHDDTLIRFARAALGIPDKSKVSHAVYAEYLIDPKTGKVHFGKDAGIGEFLCAVANKRQELLKTQKTPYKPRFLKENKGLRVVS